MDFRADGILFAAVNIAGGGRTGSDHLATLNTGNGQATIIGPFGACEGVGPIPVNGSGECDLEGIEAIAFDAAGNLWGAKRQRGAFGAPRLYTIDQNTGAAVFFAPILDAGGNPPSGGVVSLQFACDGTLYGGTATGFGAPDGGFLVTINPVTGLFAFVGGVSATGGSSLGALAFELPCTASFDKTLTSGPDADGQDGIDLVVEVGQPQTTAYDFTLDYINPGGPPVLIVDTAPAEWQVVLVNGDAIVNGSSVAPISDGGGGTAIVFPANKKPNNKSSTKIHWTPDPSGGGSILVDMTTRCHANRRNSKCRPTSCGALFLNSGPAQVFELDPATGEPLRDLITGEKLPPLFEAGPLCLAAVKDLDGGGLVLDGSGDEDGDGFTDLEEACVLGTDPCIFTNVE